MWSKLSGSPAGDLESDYLLEPNSGHTVAEVTQALDRDGVSGYRVAGSFVSVRLPARAAERLSELCVPHRQVVKKLFE